MKDLVNAQYQGSKDDIKRIKEVIGFDNAMLVEIFDNEKASIIELIMELKNDIHLLNSKLDNLENRLLIAIDEAISVHANTMPHNDPVIDITKSDHDWLINLIRHEANDVARVAVMTALSNVNFSMSYDTSHGRQFGYVDNRWHNTNT